MSKTPLFEVTQAIGLISLQTQTDLTRQHLGFTASGSADEYAFLNANKILGNELGAYALELCYAKFAFTVRKNCLITFTGADCQPTINGKKVQLWQPIELSPGDSVSTNFATNGNYTYMAVRDGFNPPKRFDSTPLNTLDNETISKCLVTSNKAISAPVTEVKSAQQYQQFYAEKEITLRFIPHPIWHQLSQHQQSHFLSDTFTLDGSSDKMGVRLSGNGLKLIGVNNLLSKPVCYGAIQIPNNGQPIVLMKDRQTIGGYPTLGSVMQVDLFRLSQMRPGDKIKFIPIKVEQAQNQLTSFYQKFK